MLSKVFFSLLFLLPLFGSLSVVGKGIVGEMKKKNIDGQMVNNPKLCGLSILLALGLYVALFLIWLIWVPNLDIPYSLKIISYCLAAPYLLGVIGVSFALQKTTEFGASSSKMAKAVSDAIDEG